MNSVSGKVLIWSDQHFGVKNNAQNRQKICVDVTKKVYNYVVKNNVKTIISGGDWFHSRNQVDVSTINVAYKCLKLLASKCRCIMILGNHDLYNKNTVDINSVNMFQDIDNVEIVSTPTEIDINNKKCLLVPWLSDLSKFGKNSFDYMIGHFEISSKYLISSYIEEHSKNDSISDELVNMIDSDSSLKSSKDNKSNNEVGDFVELCKKNGAIFAGHIHKHKEFMSKGRNFMFIGSPYQQNMGDIGNECGFYIIDDNNKIEFNEIEGIPKHIRIKYSNIISKGIDEFDFSELKGNIIQKIYDIDVKPTDEVKITQKINDIGVYEELLSDYQVKLDFNDSDKTKEELHSVELLKKSKLDYVKNYIDNIDDSIIEEKNIDKDKLFKIMCAYYKKVSGE